MSIKSRAEALQAAGYEAIQEGRLPEGATLLNESRKELGKPVWKNVEAMYPAMLQSADARRMWPFSNMPRRSRTGE